MSQVTKSFFPLCVGIVLIVAAIAQAAPPAPPEPDFKPQYWVVTAPPSDAKPASTPTYWVWAETPPMGWNSYNSFGDSVTEAEFRTNAVYLKEHLLKYGWQYVVVDYRWYDPGAHSSDVGDRAGAKLTMDRYGRLLPAPNRFPSASDGKGFTKLAADCHAMGLKFGIHVMRGIPRLAVAGKMPIEGSKFNAADAANVGSTCVWCPDMYGVRADTPAGQDWYDSILRLYAQWGVDFVKIDDLSAPYSDKEIEALRKAIDHCGRKIVFSTSPGDTPVDKGSHVRHEANMWRVSGDFWDHWPSLKAQFGRLDAWTPHRGPGHWPDADMIPLGRLAIRCHDGGIAHMTRFTRDEQVTMMTLWAIARSPLMLGMNLPDNDAWTESLLTNEEMLAVNQHSAGNRQLFRNGDQIAWVADVPGSKDRYLAIFNASDSAADLAVSWKDLGLSGSCRVRDLWKKTDLGSFRDQFTSPVPVHGAMLLRVSP